ncbi:MAG TPA: hypothetical protein VL688_12300 [Verrucomicrobiae bacterium]|jgi:hypothetical protein|nr:hypothetical protein [Verrucomicrobiae bacterium]
MSPQVTAQQPKAPRLFSLAAISAALAIGVWTALDRGRLLMWFYRYSYYAMGLLFFMWIYGLVLAWREAKPDARRFLKENGAGLLFCLALAALVFISSRPQYRLLSDETNLLSVSKSMLYDKHVANVTQGKWFHYNFYAEEYQPEKRPFLFPFVTYLAHTILGFHAWNPFVVNFFSLAALLFLVFVYLRKHASGAAAYAAVLLAAAQPVVTQTATSASMDMLAPLVFLAVLLTVKYFLDRPGPDSFLLLWLHLLLLANARYEGPLYAALVLGLLAWSGRLKAGYFRSSAVYPLTPLVLLPVFWQRFMIPTDLEVPPGVKPFSLEHLFQHTLDFLGTLTRFDFVLPYATLVNLAGLAGLLFFATRFAARRWPAEKPQRQAVSIAAFLFLAYWVLINAHFSPFALIYDGSRLLVPAVLALSVFAALLLERLPLFKRRPFYLLMASFSLFCLYHPVTIENRGWNAVLLTREYKFMTEFFEKQKQKNFLVVAYRTGIYAAREYGAVNFYSANANKDELLGEFGHHLFSDIFVIQEIVCATDEPTPETRLDPAFHLQKILEYAKQYPASSKMRLSRVVL